MEEPRQPRYQSLDLWRGLACLLVVALHSSNDFALTHELRERVVNHGGTVVEWAAAVTGDFWIGVPMFFVISGYCIAASSDAARRSPHPTRRFFVRRFRRIYPPLWAFLGLTLLAVVAIPQEYFPGEMKGLGYQIVPLADLQAANWFGMVTLSEEWRHNFGGPPKAYLCGHLWSLCYEEQFYVVAGILLAVARRRFFTGIAVVTAIVMLNLAMEHRLLRTGHTGFFFEGLWLIFALGVAVYYQINYATPFISRCMSFAYAAQLAFSVQSIPSWLEMHANFASYMVVGNAFALLLILLHRYDAAIASLKVLAPITYCGRMCYSLYLVHAPIAAYIAWNCYRLGVTDPLGTLLITLPLGMVLSIAAGWLFHRFVETRFLNTIPSKPLKSGERRSHAVVEQRDTVQPLSWATSPAGSSTV